MISHEAGLRCQNAYLRAPSVRHLTRVMLGEGRQSSRSVPGLSFVQAFPLECFFFFFVITSGIHGFRKRFLDDQINSSNSNVGPVIIAVSFNFIFKIVLYLD